MRLIEVAVYDTVNGIGNVVTVGIDTEDLCNLLSVNSELVCIKYMKGAVLDGCLSLVNFCLCSVSALGSELCDANCTGLIAL